MSFADGNLDSDEEVELYNQGYREAQEQRQRRADVTKGQA